MIVFGYTLIVVMLGAVIIGFITGVLSVFFTAKRESILGDAIAHSSLAGITLVFILLQEQVKLGLILGALISSLLAVLLIYGITRYTMIKEDAAIGIILSLFFGLGIALLSKIQQTTNSSQANLEHYLFGNIAFLRLRDLITVFILSIIVLLVLAVFWKELKMISFDPEYAKTIGKSVFMYDILVLVLVVVTIVIGVELLGVIMIAGLLIAPAIAARQWSDNFGLVVLLAGLFGSIAGVIGTLLSASTSDLPAGPTIILIMAGIVLFSLVFAKNGLLSDQLTTVLYRIQFDVEETLEHLATHMLFNPRSCDIREFDVQERHDEFPTTHLPNHKLYDDLNVLIQLGYVKPREGGNWILTHKGMIMVQKMESRIKIPIFAGEMSV